MNLQKAMISSEYSPIYFRDCRCRVAIFTLFDPHLHIFGLTCIPFVNSFVSGCGTVQVARVPARSVVAPALCSHKQLGAFLGASQPSKRSHEHQLHVSMLAINPRDL